MLERITIWTTGHNFFFSGNYNHILYLRNEFRIYGNLVNISIVSSNSKHCVFYSVEEILAGIEFGFIIIRKIKHKKGKQKKNLLLKFFCNKLSNLNKNLIYSKQAFFLEKECQITVRHWREYILLHSNIFKKNSIFSRLIFKKIKYSKKIANKSVFLKCYIDKLYLNHFYKYKIFRDLWQRGFIITCGIKFGATYLIYAGEINTVHASSSIIVMEKPMCILICELISYGRIGTTTKKNSILANISKNFFITYFGLRWNKFLP